MGKIGRTYPRHDLGQAVVPEAPARLIFARKALARRMPGVLWLTALVCVLLLGWPSA